MDLLANHINAKAFCDRIKSSSYEQTKQTKSCSIYPTIIDLFFSIYDHHYELIEGKDKALYIDQLIIEIASGIDEDKQTNYDKFNYLRCMDSTLIQQGLQSMNSISSLLYLSDYYGVTTNIYISSLMKKVRTSDKTRKEFNIIYTSDCKWGELTDTVSDKFKDGDFKDLGECLVLDVTTKDIYKKYLNPIGKYKAAELIEIAKTMDVPVDKDGKKKVKKQLYEDINLYQLNLK